MECKRFVWLSELRFAVIKRLFFVLSCWIAVLVMATFLRGEKKRLASVKAERMREVKRLKHLQKNAAPSHGSDELEREPHADPGLSKQVLEERGILLADGMRTILAILESTSVK